jgi:signal transduction histidine kinase
LLFAAFFVGLTYVIVYVRSQYLKKENRILEEKVNHRTEQLKKSIDDLKSTQSQLIHSEKMASLGELTAGIAHEIQNPLNFVNNFSEVSEELVDEMNEELEKGDYEEAKAISKDLKENLNKIKHHGKRADSIVKGMLEHSRGSTSEKKPTNINDLADEFLRLSYHGLRAKDKSFNADFEKLLDPNLPPVNVVAQDVGRVLLNLINNAFYACAERSRSTSAERDQHTSENGIPSFKPKVSVLTRVVGLTESHGGVEICIKDNGSGIPKAIKDKIFQPFFTTKPTGSGTGLGLSLSYDIIKAHGGDLRVKSTEGEGTEMIIFLPIEN